jgi:hypothetical protein
MTVAKLIEELQKLPQDADVQFSSNDGCSECNPEGDSNYHDVDGPRLVKAGELWLGYGGRTNKTDIVML